MIFQAKSDPKSTGKFGVDFDVYMQDLKILLIEARLHGGILDEMQQLYDLAIGKYRDGIENYKDMIGQCNN